MFPNAFAVALIFAVLALKGESQRRTPGRPPFVVVPPQEEFQSSASRRRDVVLAEPSPPRPPLVVAPPPRGGPPTTRKPADMAKTPDPNVIALVDANLDDKCFHCLCKASSDCQDLDCVLVGPDAYFCGTYHISWAYWVDSGKPGDVPGNPFAFEDCLKERPCAERSIRGYMHKFARDCNGDGIIDCVDYARIHKAGPNNCNGTWVDNTLYWGRFQDCWSGGLDLRNKARV